MQQRTLDRPTLALQLKKTYFAYKIEHNNLHKVCKIKQNNERYLFRRI